MKTNHPEYDQSFEAIVEQRQQGKQERQAKAKKITGPVLN